MHRCTGSFSLIPLLISAGNRLTPPPPLCGQVLSIEKAESTSSLPNPVIVSVRTKKAFQLIELQDRDELVDSLNCRLRAVHWKQSMFRNRKDSKRSVVRSSQAYLWRTNGVQRKHLCRSVPQSSPLPYYTFYYDTGFSDEEEMEEQVLRNTVNSEALMTAFNQHQAGAGDDKVESRF